MERCARAPRSSSSANESRVPPLIVSKVVSRLVCPVRLPRPRHRASGSAVPLSQTARSAAFRVARVRGKPSAMLPRHEPAGASRPVKAEMIRSPLRSLFTMIATAPRVSLSHAHRQVQDALLRRGNIADARASCLDIADRPWLFVFVSGCRLRSVVLQLATARVRGERCGVD